MDDFNAVIFDSAARNDLEPKRYRESLFGFLNRCAWPEAENIRSTLEKWYTEFPPHERRDLRNRLRSGDDFNYNSAVLEIVLHTMLTRLRYEVDVHPVLPTGKKRPDFGVRGSEPFFLEAAVASGESVQQRSANQRTNAVYDALNQLWSPDFFIGLELHGSPLTPPPSRAMRNFLAEKLALLDDAALKAAFEDSGDLDCAPRWRYEHAGWVIDFFPIPKSPQTRGKAGIRPIAAFLPEAECRIGSAAFRNTLSRKAGKYGQVGVPFIIAVNAIDHADDIDVTDALFGQECTEVTVSESGTRERQSRVRNGIWVGPQGARNTRLSAVLAIFGLTHSNIASVGVRLYKNPWAARPYEGQLCRFAQLAPVDGRMVSIPGIRLGDILGLPSSWPNTVGSE